MASRIRVIAVIGPTASGKTEIGLKLAQRTGGEIISVDSMQIYRWMDVGTAKPTPEMRRSVPHHLIDILNPDQEYNSGKFAADADNIIQSLHNQGKPSILVGGTGLYFRALIHGIIPVQTISDSIRKRIRQMSSEKGPVYCHKKLSQLDPKSAEKLHPNDISRVSRALEVVLETGKSIQEFQQQHQFQQKRYDILYLGANWSRDLLYDRINSRVYQMVNDGLIEEAKNLQKMGYQSDLPSLNSIGYKQAIDHINGNMNLEDMIADIQQKSRHYAKKQITWYKKDPSIQWLDKNNLENKILIKVDKFLRF